MKKLLIGLVAMTFLSMAAQAEDSMFCSEQLGGMTTGAMQVRKLCLNSRQLILSFEDTSNCHGFYNGNDRCIKKLGKKFNEVFNIESVESNVKVDELDVTEGVSISKISLLNLKTGNRSFILAQSTTMENCVASGITGSVLNGLLAYYVCK